MAAAAALLFASGGIFRDYFLHFEHAFHDYFAAI